MAREIQRDDRASGGMAGARSERAMTREMSELVAMLADQPSDGLLWSDIGDHLRSGFASVRRLLTSRHAHADR